MKKIVVKQEEEQPVPVEILARSIVEFDKGVRRMEAAGLNRRAVALLLRDALPTNLCPSLSSIMAVLDYLPRLTAIYMKKK